MIFYAYGKFLTFQGFSLDGLWPQIVIIKTAKLGKFSANPTLTPAFVDFKTPTSTTPVATFKMLTSLTPFP